MTLPTGKPMAKPSEREGQALYDDLAHRLIERILASRAKTDTHDVDLRLASIISERDALLAPAPEAVEEARALAHGCLREIVKLIGPNRLELEHAEPVKALIAQAIATALARRTGG